MKRFTKSMWYALRGGMYVIKNERNFRIELGMATAVFLLMTILNVHYQEKLLIVFVVMWVLALELINTAIERIMDILKPRVHPYARVVKDIMAAAVLLSSFGAALIGIIIFIPYFYYLFA